MTCLKLSPNLRKAHAAAAAAAPARTESQRQSEQAAWVSAEQGRLEGVMGVARKDNAALQQPDWELM